jgi:hypothetical protein
MPPLGFRPSDSVLFRNRLLTRAALIGAATVRERCMATAQYRTVGDLPCMEESYRRIPWLAAARVTPRLRFSNRRRSESVSRVGSASLTAVIADVAQAPKLAAPRFVSALRLVASEQEQRRDESRRRQAVCATCLAIILHGYLAG